MKMDSSATPVDLSALSPPIQVDEALSSWLVRIAEAHMLTVVELEREMGGSISSTDRGDGSLLPRIAAMTRVDLETLRELVPLDLISCPMRQGPRPPFSWAVCAHCLSRDLQANAPPFIRRCWTHPLACFCPVHRTALVPHGQSPIKIATAATLHGDGKDCREPCDMLLERAEFDDPATINRVCRALTNDRNATGLKSRIKLRWAVRDVADALALNRRTPNGGALISLFENVLLGRRSRPGFLRLPLDHWSDVDAATRLLLARLALLILADPRDPTEGAKEPLGASWLMSMYHHNKVGGWQGSFTHAIRDPLFFLTTELPKPAVLELNERSKGWPYDLRRRWTYAIAVAATGGYL